jgi:cytochrome c peroxidase
MRRDTRALVRAAFATVLGVLSVPLAGSTEVRAQTPPPYNPYPSGILPANLDSEIARVRREVNGIFEEAIGEWRAIPPPVLSNTQGTGNPPTLQGTGYEAVEILGKLLNFDENMSPFRNEACSFCHMPYAAFSGPIPSVNLTMIAYPGTAQFRAGQAVSAALHVFTQIP